MDESECIRLVETEEEVLSQKPQEHTIGHPMRKTAFSCTKFGLRQHSHLLIDHYYEKIAEIENQRKKEEDDKGKKLENFNQSLFSLQKILSMNPINFQI